MGWYVKVHQVQLRYIQKYVHPHLTWKPGIAKGKCIEEAMMRYYAGSRYDLHREPKLDTNCVRAKFAIDFVFTSPLSSIVEDNITNLTSHQELHMLLIVLSNMCSWHSLDRFFTRPIRCHVIFRSTSPISRNLWMGSWGYQRE